MIGAGIGGAVSYLTTSKQIAAQTQQAEDEFLRNQRQIVYSEFYQAGMLILGDRQAEPVDRTFLTIRRSRAVAASKAISKAERAVDLYASTGATTAATRVINECNTHIGLLDKLLYSKADPTAKGTTDKILKSENSFLARVGDFQAAAREDFRALST